MSYFLVHVPVGIVGPEDTTLELDLYLLKTVEQPLPFQMDSAVLNIFSAVPKYITIFPN